MKSTQTKLAVGAIVAILSVPALAQQAQLQEIDLTPKSQEKVVDAVTGAKWLGKKIGHGTKVSAKFIYKKALHPIAIGAEDAADLVTQGTVFVALSAKKGTIAIEHVVVNGTKVVYEDAARPFFTTLVEKPLKEAGKIVILDGAYKMVLKPIGVGLKEAARNDLVTGARAAGAAEKEGSKVAAKDVATDSVAVYDVALKPVGKAAAKSGKAVARGVVRVGCEVADSTREEPRGCSASAQLKADAND